MNKLGNVNVDDQRDTDGGVGQTNSERSDDGEDGPGEFGNSHFLIF